MTPVSIPTHAVPLYSLPTFALLGQPEQGVADDGPIYFEKVQVLAQDFKKETSNNPVKILLRPS